MSVTFEAVYEHGMFRPTEPVGLEEGMRVTITITPLLPSPEGKSPAEILAEIAALPMEEGGREFAARDHDRILYGESTGS